MPRIVASRVLRSWALLAGSALVCAWIGPPVAGATIRVATFQADVTPPLGHPVYPSFLPLATIQEPLLAKGVLLDDGQRRYVLCAIDYVTLGASTRDLIRQRMADAAGTQRACCTIQCVHQHSSAAMNIAALDVLDTLPSPPPYLQRAVHDAIVVRIGAAVKEAVARLEPCDRIGVSQAKVECVASSRRLLQADGKVLSRMSSTKNKPALREAPEGSIDPLLKTITFARGDTPLVRLHYYATHPQSYYGDPRASSDFVGVAREKLQQEEGVFQVYFTGCAGDVAAGKYNDGTPEARARLTERIYQGLKQSVAATRFQELGPLIWRTATVTFQARVDGDYAPDKLRAQMANPKVSNNLRIRAARCLVYQQQTNEPIELCALQINQIYMLYLPGEPVVAFQRYAQHRRPEGFVAVAGYGHEGPSYICTDEMPTQGGYEAWATMVASGAEGRLKTAIDQLLGLPSP